MAFISNPIDIDGHGGYRNHMGHNEISGTDTEVISSLMERYFHFKVIVFNETNQKDHSENN